MNWYQVYAVCRRTNQLIHLTSFRAQSRQEAQKQVRIYDTGPGQTEYYITGLTRPTRALSEWLQPQYTITANT